MMTMRFNDDSKYDVNLAIEIPEKLVESWQKTIDLMAKLIDVPAGLIMRVHENEIEVFTASNNADNIYKKGEKAGLDTGLYCETVMDSRQPLLVPNAKEDLDWDHNPDIDLGMISYLGLPLSWPDDKIFGTVCVLDGKSNQYSQLYIDLVAQFRDAVQLGLNTLYDQHQLTIAQEQLAQSAKLASIGQMSANLAHELNQPLGVISMAAEISSDLLAQASFSGKKLIAKNLDKIGSQVERADKIIQGLMVFSREGGSNKYSDANVNNIINQTLVLLDDMLKKNGIALALEREQRLPNVYCDYVQIQQVLTNLLINSCYALEFLTDKPDKKITIRTYIDNNNVCIQVEDNGSGIAKADLKKIFDPFFTTKPQGQGTGLGLSISYGIIKKHQGQLTVKSEVGNGCCFTVTLPSSTCKVHNN